MSKLAPPEASRPSLRAARAGVRWARAARRQAAAGLSDHGLQAELAPPTSTDRGSLPAIRATLYLQRASCLERSFVLQRWWLERGYPLDVVIGVRPDGDKIKAHAWLDRFDPDQSDEYEVIRRHSAS